MIRQLLSFFALGIFFISCQSQTIQEKNLRKDIQLLASDSLEGRGSGTAGEKMAAAYIISQLKAIDLDPKGAAGSFLQPFPVKGGVHQTGPERTANNVIGYLDNGAPNTIILGAHYDHLGLGYDGSSLQANSEGMIHNGADDNASGTAGLLELARYFKLNNVKESNNMLFIWFSGEELGLFGSKYFTEHPTIDLSQVTYMINLDMIGRLDTATHALEIGGTGTSPVWEPELLKVRSNFKIKTDSSGMGPSDHTSFYLKNIPVLHFFTGSHRDYHKPSDDADKINYAGEVEVLQLITQIVSDLDPAPKLTFLTTKNKSTSSSRSFKVTLGIMPSYTSSVEGLQVDGVSEGKPAYASGMKTGDIIIKMGDLDIKDIEGYMNALGKFEKGQTIPVQVRRGNEIVELTVTF